MIAVNLVDALVDGGRAAVGISAVVYALASIGLNVQFGFAGLQNFGHVASGLVGAYSAAISVNQGLPLWAGVLIGIVAALLLGLLLGLPTLRLRADYLAIVTIATAEILRVVVNSARLQSITGGPIGLGGVSDDFYAINPIPPGRYGFGAFKFNDRDLWLIIVGWFLVAIATALVWRLVHSPWGRLLKAVREDEDAARSLGKNVFGAKLQSLLVGSVICSIAGVIFTLDGGFAKADFFVSQVTFNWYLVVILGGVGTVLGPVVGAIVYWFVLSFLNSILVQLLGNEGWGPIAPSDTGSIRYILIGVALVLLLVFRPQGLLGSRAGRFSDV
jgi:branched-chain amino acid transport system permease protein